MNTKHTLALVAAAALLGMSTAASADCTKVAGNLIKNCGFETGDFTGWTVAGIDTTTSQGQLLYGVEGLDPFPLPNGTAPNSGTSQVYVTDPYNPLTLSQSVATTVGSTYTVSFYLAQIPLDGDTLLTNALTASFGSSNLASLSNVANSGYTFYTYDVAATTTSTTFSLAMTDLTGEFLLDDVSVTKDPVAAVPETSTPLLMGAGLLALGAFARRKRRQ